MLAVRPFCNLDLKEQATSFDRNMTTAAYGIVVEIPLVREDSGAQATPVTPVREFAYDIHIPDRCIAEVF